MVMQDSYDSSTIHFLNSYQFMVIARLNPPASLTFPGGRSEDEAEKSLPQHSGWTCRPQWVHVGDQEFLQLENMNRPPKTVAVCSLYFVIFRLEMSVCFFNLQIFADQKLRRWGRTPLKIARWWRKSAAWNFKCARGRLGGGRCKKH